MSAAAPIDRVACIASRYSVRHAVSASVSGVWSLRAMDVELVQDAADPRLEPYRSVRDRDATGGAARPGLFIGESPLVIQAMLRTGVETLSILTAERHAPRAIQMVEDARPAAVPRIFVAPDAVLDAVVGFHIHRGFLAVGRRPAPRTMQEALAPAAGRASTLLCVEEINNIDNVGQLMRNAAAFGCDAVLLSPACHDPLYRKSLRVSCGCALTVPFVRSAQWDADLRALRDHHGYMLVGATGGGECTVAECAQRLAEMPAAARRVAVVVGAEFAGLCAQTLEVCSVRARIPMAPGVDSLNVAVAAAVFLDRLAQR